MPSSVGWGTEYHPHTSNCYELMQVFTVTGLFAGQHNTKLHGTITGVILYISTSVCVLHTPNAGQNMLF